MARDLADDDAIAAADTLLVTIPNQIGVSYYNTHLIGGLLLEVAPATGWR